MTTISVIRDQIAASGLAGMKIEIRGRELRIETEVETLPALAGFLDLGFRVRPELILAEDTRSRNGHFTLRHIFEMDGADAVVVVTTQTNDGEFPSLATRWYLASLFEREIRDLFGLQPVGHPDLRRLPLHQFWPEDCHPLLKDARVPEFVDDGAPFPFRQVTGEGTYEITVGPVHAGIIEPGHFRFSVEGETIVNLESRLYFVHKGIEKLFETMPLQRGVDLAERVSGDSSVAHGLAFCAAVESCAGIEAPSRAAFGRVVLLELERLYNHIADIGAICTDTGFALANAHCLRLREDLLRLNARLTGHRLLRGVLCPGGMKKDFREDRLAEVNATVARMVGELAEIVEIAVNNSLVSDRLHGTGVLIEHTAREMQVCGMAARASGIDRDARRDHPFAAYGNLEFRVPVFKEGDVWARLMVRAEEAQQSAGLIQQAIDAMPPGRIAEPIEELPVESCALGLVEGWRGPIWHWVVGAGERLDRVKIKDPSFSNWPALSYAILNNIVPDFPLVNKSFNLSYAGNDL